MIRNPLIPYAIIAILGVVTVIVVSYFGVNQREAIQNPDAVEAGETLEDPEEIYKNTCASCHGDDLSGETATELQQVGNRLSEEEIKTIIIEGTDTGMPGGLVNNEEAEILSEWLAEQE